ncbi:carbohydrate ABC transporter permease [Microbacterium sp. DT81.1]|uniref:carbohydrate ABC transporter permease n=1 Tax=Microbacterium sp. DT81.1 TaxID=3393413 RepID=UPI003CECB54B
MAQNSSASRSDAGYLSHGLVWIYALILAVPLYYLLVTSFKQNQEIFTAPAALPTSFDLGNYIDAAQFTEIGQALSNSAMITIGAEAITLALALPAAYGLARATGRLARVVEGVFAGGFLIPAFAALVPTVLLAISLDLFYNPLFLILFFPATQLPLSVILLTQFMRAIPAELEESAMMDGASRWSILWQVYAPLVVPGIVTVALLNFLTFWNEYLFSLSILGVDPAIRTVQVAVPTLIGGQATNAGTLAAACVISIIPVFIVYAIFNRQMENALVAGALKG